MRREAIQMQTRIIDDTLGLTGIFIPFFYQRSINHYFLISCNYIISNNDVGGQVPIVYNPRIPLLNNNVRLAMVKPGWSQASTVETITNGYQ